MIFEEAVEIVQGNSFHKASKELSFNGYVFHVSICLLSFSLYVLQKNEEYEVNNRLRERYLRIIRNDKCI